MESRTQTSPPMVKRIAFVPERYYHLYNHAVGNENLFRQDDNYHYFMKLYDGYASPIVETFAYCLMPNHFHFLIRIRSSDTLQAFFEEQRKAKGRSTSVKKSLTNQIGQQLGNWFNAYAKAYNKRFYRRGRLFFDSVQRKPVYKTDYLQTLIGYIHWNPVYHGFVDSPEDWPHSSYRSSKHNPAGLTLIG